MSSSRLAKRYAKALFSLGQEDGSYSQYGKELKEFADFCRENSDFGNAIANPVFAADDRKKVLEYVLLKSQFSIMTKNFLNLLLEKNRIGAIGAISDFYSKLTDEASNISGAEIITAKPLKDEALRKIIESLEKLTSKKIRASVKEDDNLIGGVLVRIGDLVLDGSVKAQLEGLKESL
ncbi:MAG: ATP synthase F1 subunit delta [Deltaproteobacteria bacterium]|nr:ATP synthase F1 subunit delta [Deltaproteobacteria bacterium]